MNYEEANEVRSVVNVSPSSEADSNTGTLHSNTLINLDYLACST